MLIGRVVDTFEIKGRGVVVAIDTTYEQLPPDLKLKIDDPIELRMNGEVVLRTKIAGIEHCERRQRHGSCRPSWIKCHCPSGQRSMPSMSPLQRFMEWTTCSPGIARTLPTRCCGNRSSRFAEPTAMSRRRPLAWRNARL
jgi:hypothetical protein